MPWTRERDVQDLCAGCGGTVSGGERDEMRVYL